MLVGSGRRLSQALRALLGVAVCCGAQAAWGADSSRDAEPANRFYAGVALGSLYFHDSYAGVNLHDSSVGLGVFGGAYLKDRLSLELSYDSFTAIDLRNVAGSGVTRFDVESRRRTAGLSVVREVSMRDIFEWRRDWRVFGMAGVYRSSISRAVTVLGTGATSAADEGTTGALLGAGVLYKVGPVDLRGYFREFGVLDNKEGRDFGIVVQRSF
jgi:hypothetical protein